MLRRAEREWGWLDRVPAIRLLQTPKRRVRWLTFGEAGRLLAELPSICGAWRRLPSQLALGSGT